VFFPSFTVATSKNQQVIDKNWVKMRIYKTTFINKRKGNNYAKKALLQNAFL